VPVTVGLPANKRHTVNEKQGGLLRSIHDNTDLHNPNLPGYNWGR